MDERVKVWLYDILNAIHEIDSFFGEGTRDFVAYQQDIKTRRAVERNMEIIGEAMSRILKFDETIQITHARKLVDVRNRIIHGYDTVSDDIMWGILMQHLPSLHDEVENLLAQ